MPVTPTEKRPSRPDRPVPFAVGLTVALPPALAIWAYALGWL